MTDPDDGGATAEDFAQRLFTATLATAETMSVYLGERLGWYADLAAHGPTTAAGLAERTGTSGRYAREWLEMQSASGILDTDLTDPPTFTLPEGAREVLLDEQSLNYLGALPRMFAASFRELPALLDAYRTGGGVSWQQFGADARECQAALNRPWFSRELAPALAGVEHLDGRLRAPDARIADVGCGGGWSSIALAQAYPRLRVDGVDVDEPSLVDARANAAAAGVADRVSFTLADGDSLARQGPYDAVFAFECLHDMPRPVDVLAAARASLADGASMIVMDEAVGEEFAGPADELDRLMYAFSLFVCLPDGMSSTPSAATGTVMRCSTLETYARDAGFSEVRVLPIEDFSFFRFYELATAA